MRKTSQFATAADTFDIEAIMREVEMTERRPVSRARNVAFVDFARGAETGHQVRAMRAA